jgi:hypothetical protein
MTDKEFSQAISGLSSSDRERVNKLCAERINTVWEERGETVNARVETRHIFNGRVHVPSPVVVSETMNGLPK